MKKSFIRISIFLALFIFGGFLLHSSVLAEEYSVKSVIIIPPDWQGKLSKQDLETYKSGIINGLNAVRVLYANILLGKTFTFDRNIETVASKDPIDKVEEKLMLDRDYRSSFYSDVFPARKGVVYIAWGIGTKNGVRRGDPVSKEFGFVWLKHQDILGLSSDGTEDERKWSLSMLAHELGHAFGLVFAGYADGHPCTEESSQECSANAPRPYPGSYEWASIMGYGTPYLSFPNLFFNNSIYNPEIQKIYKSPFINPNADPAPSPTAGQTGQKQQGPVFFELSPGTIIAGQNFAIKGVNLEKFREFEIRRKDLANSINKDRLQNAKMLDNNGSTIRINVAEDAVPPESDSNWEIKLLDKSGNLTIPVELGIKGKNAAGGIILAADITATCGPDKKGVQSAPVRLQSRGNTLTSINTQPDGTAILNYTIENPQSGNQYELVADQIQGITPVSDSPGSAGSSSKTITVPGSNESFNSTASFNYPDCPQVCNPKITFLCGGIGDAAGFPKGHTIKITPSCTSTNMYGEGLGSKEDLGDRNECQEGVVIPNVTAGLPTPTERVSSRGSTDTPQTDSQGAPIIGPGPDTYVGLTADIAAAGPKIIISNYANFQDGNEEGDVGSPTTIVDPGSTVEWTLSTLGSADDRQVSVAEITDGGVKSKNTPYLRRDGGIIEAGGVTIKTKTVKDYITKITVNVNGAEREVDINNPEEGLPVRLDGTEGQPQTFSMSAKVYYADRAAPDEIPNLTVAYQPPRDCECPFSNSCTTANGEPGTQECSGVWSNGPGSQCVFDKTGECVIQCKTCEAGATPEPEATLEPTPTPTPPPPETNYCKEAGYYPCTPDTPNGTCTLNGQTCTAYNTYQCNFNGQNYCDTSRCDVPCEAPPPPDCGEPEFKYNQCVACDISEPVYQDSCGKYSTGSYQSDTTGQCSGPEWCGAPPAPETNYCEEAGYYACAPGEPNGSCSLNGQTCTAYSTYQCNFNGQNYCDTSTCGEPCEGAPPASTCPNPEATYEQCGYEINPDACQINEPYNPDDVIEVTKKYDAQCTDYYLCRRVGPIEGRCGYYPQPGGPPPTPSVYYGMSCIDYGHTGSDFSISWGDANPAVQYVDISTDNFASFWNKGVSGNSTDAPNGFNPYQGVNGSLTFDPGKTYQVRLYNGTWSGTAEFITPPSCGQGGCQEGNNNRNECIGCNLSQGICQHADCSEYLCIPSQPDNCPDWCADTPPNCTETTRDFEQCGGTTGLEDKDPTHTYIVREFTNPCTGDQRYEVIDDAGNQGQCS